MNVSASMPLMVVAVVAVIAGGIDVVRFKIPNWITVPLFGSGVIYHAWVGGFPALGNSLAGVLFNLFLVLLFYLIGAMGAGDVKFMAGVGAWLGMPLSAYAFFVAALATGVYSVCVLIWEGGLARASVTLHVLMYQVRQLGVLSRHLSGLERVEEIAKRSDRRRRLVPFAAMVALGVIAIIFSEMYFAG